MRSRQLRKLQEEHGAKAAKAASTKSAKRKRPAAAARKRKQRMVKPGEVVLDPSVAAQMVATCTHADAFLDNLLAVANAQTPVQPLPQNMLTPAPVAPIPQNVLSSFDPSVPQNVMSPFAPLNQFPVAPTTTTVLTGEDIRELSQSLDKMEKLSEWITTALGQVQSVKAVLRKILRR